MDQYFEALTLVALMCGQPSTYKDSPKTIAVEQCRKDLMACFIPDTKWRQVIDCIKNTPLRK